MDIELSKIKKVFFIGIGGIGISAGAQMALSRGMEVLGVNDEESVKTLEPLREAGAIIFYQNELKELPDADLYVFSDAWIYRGPEYIMQARKTGKSVMSYFEFLGILAKKYKVIAIAGTHGKTTTTAMVAEILVDAGLDPTVVVGSFVKKFGSNFRKGNSDCLVVEADEYNRHFLNFRPYLTAVTNIEADHLDCYKDLADIQNAFGQLVAQTEGAVIYNGKDTSSHALVHDSKIKTIDYIKYLEKIPKLSVPGLHNRMNASTAYAAALFLGVDEEIIKKSLANFSGTWRRLEQKGITKAGTIIYDDYAHHPTEIKASLQALQELYTGDDKKITVLFQPHLYSRTKALFGDFVLSFGGADRILMLPIYYAREEKDESVSSFKLAQAIRLQGMDAQAFPDFQSAENAILALNLGSKDVFVTMGAGEAYKVADKVFKLA